MVVLNAGSGTVMPHTHPEASQKLSLLPIPRETLEWQSQGVKSAPKLPSASQSSLLGGRALGIDDGNSIFGNDYNITAVSPHWRGSEAEDLSWG